GASSCRDSKVSQSWVRSSRPSSITHALNGCALARSLNFACQLMAAEKSTPRKGGAKRRGGFSWTVPTPKPTPSTPPRRDSVPRNWARGTKALGGPRFLFGVQNSVLLWICFQCSLYEGGGLQITGPLVSDPG